MLTETYIQIFKIRLKLCVCVCVCVHFLYVCDSAKYFHALLREKIILHLISKVPKKVWHIMAGDIYLFEFGNP